jgi:predicted RNase H-like HicB family nuclease
MPKPAEYYISLPMPTSTNAYGDGYRVDVIHWPGCFAVGETIDKAEAALRPAMGVYVRALLAKKQEPKLPSFGDYPDLHAATVAFQAGVDLGRRQGVAVTMKRYDLKPLPKDKQPTPETDTDDSEPISTTEPNEQG